MTWWYLSFVGESGFLGAAVVEIEEALGRVEGLVEATRQAHRLGINPGGSVMAFPMADISQCPAKYRNRLLSRADLEAAGAKPITLGDLEAKRAN